MNRRPHLFAGRRVVATQTRDPLPAGAHVAVVGAGIVGSAIACFLARAGAQVTVLDAETPGGVVTRQSFGWLNATFDKRPRSYYTLNRLGLLGYRSLTEGADAIPGLAVAWGGCVEWVAEEVAGARLERQAARHRRWGYDVSEISARSLRALEPALTPGPVAAAVHSREEGRVDPPSAARAFLTSAIRAGAEVRSSTKVVGFLRRGATGHRLRLEVEGGFDALDVDAVVIAAGHGSPRLVARAGGRPLPLVPSPGLLATSRPIGPCLHGVVLAPTAHLCQLPDGAILTGAEFGGGPAQAPRRDAGRRLIDEAARVLPALRGVPVRDVWMGERVMPADGLPIVGFAAPGVYVATMHSGVTLAPVIGRLTALELTGGLDAACLRRFRPQRFTDSHRS